ncbi:MAG: hypothetical protein V1655_00880 [bacterium]
MFNFFKKNKKEDEAEQAGSDKERRALDTAVSQLAGISQEDLDKDVEIHVMPAKFLVSENNANNKKKVLVIIGGFLLLIIFVLLIIFFIFKDNIFPPQKIESAPAKTETPQTKENGAGENNIIESENIATETVEVVAPDKFLCSELSDCLWRSGLPERLGGCGCFSKKYLDYLDALKNIYEEKDVIIECAPSASLESCECVLNKCQMKIATSTEEIIATSTAEAIAASTENVIATSTENVVATSTEEIIATSTPQNLDSDKDGLSDKEEVLLGTDKVLPDTDGDGYLDGLEVSNLYDPKILSPAKITDGGDIIKFYNETRYSLLYPKSWEATVSEEGKVIFDAGDGEFIELLISPNPDSLPVIDWRKAQTLGNTEGTLDEIMNKNNLRALKVNNTVYVNDYNYVYILTYNPINYEEGVSTENYSAVFSMMWQSLNSKIDTDGDGIVDYKEIDFYKTNPRNVDTDSDGHNDGDEILGGYDPLK